MLLLIISPANLRSESEVIIKKGDVMLMMMPARLSFTTGEMIFNRAARTPISPTIPRIATWLKMVSSSKGIEIRL